MKKGGFRRTKSPTKTKIGEITGIIGFSLDITDKRLAAGALKRGEEELEINNKSLEELNTALKVLLKKCDEDGEVIRSPFFEGKL